MTKVEIVGSQFHLDGAVANAGRTIRGITVEGLLMNSRMINGVFDDSNPETVATWAYPDTGVWDAERNLAEFIAAMPSWKAAGLDAITLGIQGGSPHGYSEKHPWENAGFTPEGELLPAYADRLERALRAADENGIVVIVDIFYFGQDDRLKDEDAVRNAVVNACTFLLGLGLENLLVEIANECDIHYHHDIILAPRVHELIALAKTVTVDGRRLAVSTSFTQMTRPTSAVLEVSDFVLLHGNGVADPEKISGVVTKVRHTRGFHEMPIVYNEDDHFDFEAEDNNMLGALRAGASWGYFDGGPSTVRVEADGTHVHVPFQGNYVDGFQNPPVNWSIDSSELKKQFFAALGDA